MVKSIVEAVFNYAEKTPDKLCLADETLSVTYAEYKKLICKIATVLKSANVKADDKVVIEATQTISYLATQLAIQVIGAVFVPVERNCAWDKTQRVVSASGAKLVITQKENPSYDDVVAFSMDTIQGKAAIAEEYIPTSFPESSDVAEILFSTGTTGKEKGIVLTHDNNVALAENVIYGVKMKEDNVEMIPSPMNHSHGLRRYYGNMYMGATVVLFTSVMAVKLFFDTMDKYKVNSMDLVPTALTVLLKLSKDKFAEYKDVMRYIQFGSAPLSEADMQKIRSLLPDTRLYNFYGSTESGCICIYDFNTDKDKAKCIGHPAHNARLFVVDEDRNEIKNSSAENTGLLASCGRMNMLGYFNDPEETAEAMENGVIYSKDEAYFDEDGDIILLGRKGDVINTGGNKVAPDEIEEVAKKHPSVADCGCIGVPDQFKGSVPKLFVQIKKSEEFNPVAIREFLTDNLEPYKVPASIVSIDKIPRTFNGKLLRRALKEIDT